MKKVYFVRFLLASFFLIVSGALFAQEDAAAALLPKGGRHVAAMGHFYGRIVDGKTHKGVDGVSVQLIQSKLDPVTKTRKDSAINGSITTAKGDFSFGNVPLLGSFHLKVTAIGYQLYDEKVAFDLSLSKSADPAERVNAVEKDLGNIKLQQDAETLNSVVVTASKPLIQLGIDRKIYNVEKDIAAQGGSAVDIMKNIPSLAVDIDGNVTLRNSSPTIFIDGRPTTLTLDQIPSDAIESVEIISNPGAKYDASGGTSGILNIVLKKNRRAGYNGNVRAGADKRGGYSAGANINVKQGKLNFFGGVNFRERKTVSPGTTDRFTFISDPFNKLHQVDNNINNGYFLFGRFGVDYLIDNRNTISASGTLVHGVSKPTTSSDLDLDTLYNSGYSNSSYTHRYSITNNAYNDQHGMLSYKHTFPRAGEEWTADANYSNGTNTNFNQTTSNIFQTIGSPISSIYRQQQDGNSTNQRFTAQTDFTNPINEKSKLEAGARIATRNVTSVNNSSIIGDDGKQIFQPLASSSYNYHDQVIAGYLTYSNKMGSHFGYQLGLRAENSSYHGSSTYAVKDTQSPTGLKDTLGNFSNNYPVSLFPSVYLSYKLSDDDELQLNYTRRVDRPNFFQLFPYTDYSDSLNLNRGNPNLKPQFTNSVELNYSKTYGSGNSFLASVYYKYTTDLITRYQNKEINPITDSLVLVNTFINASSSYVGGLELIGRNSITPWWDLTSNLNIFTSKINTNDSIQTQPANYSWFAKLNNTFKLPLNFTLQITGDFTSKTVLPPGGSSSQGGRGWGGTVSGNAQGYSKPTGGMDASLKFEFLKNKAASITLSVDDILKTRRSDVFVISPYSTQEAYRIRDPQFFRIQFNYRFGKFDTALFKRKNNKAGDQDTVPQNSPENPLN
jgi:outer membrane receptor protein involved in Fe transport